MQHPLGGDEQGAAFECLAANPKPFAFAFEETL